MKKSAPAFAAVLLTAVSAVIIVLIAHRGPIPQAQQYHRFVDTRSFAGITNFFDVFSNLAFFAVGLLGMTVVMRRRNDCESFVEEGEYLPYLVFFAGMCLIAGGSMYYHLAPDNWRLLWDRIPMTVSFMAFFSIVISERMRASLGLQLLLPLVALGMAGALYWYSSELRGAGDLRAYVLVQFYPIMIIPLMISLLPRRYTHGAVFILVIGIYAAAKPLEVYDREVFRFFDGMISGHTLKHLVAAVAALPVIWMLGARKAAADSYR